jgi:transcriptional regulator with XRE-family HTH domain
MSPPIATPRSRALGFGLRKARQARGLGLRELARGADVRPGDLSNWELGLRVPKVEEVALLLGRMQVSVEERTRLLELAENAREPNWLESKVGPEVAAYAEYERTATALFTWQPILVPGLLQTEDYIRAIATIPQRTRAEVQHLTEVKLSRQERLRGRDPLAYAALLDESTLRHGFGGPAVMAEQLHRLLTAMNRPNVSLRIVPATDHGHPGVWGSFSILEFPALPPIVFIEQYQGSAYLYDDDQVSAYRAAAESMTSLALSEPDSAQLLREVLAELEA